MRHFTLAAALALLAQPALAADKVTLILDWFVNPDHAPITGLRRQNLVTHAELTDAELMDAELEAHYRRYIGYLNSRRTDELGDFVQDEPITANR